MEDLYYVYYHRNKINNKYYVGQTKQKPERRWREGDGYKNNKHFHRAIEKYGWDSFEHIVVAQGLNKKDADNMEIELIQKYDSTNPEFGYNYAPGGGGVKRKHYWSSTSGKKMTEETKEKIRNKVKERLSDPEYLLKMRECQKKKSVVCLETNIIYSCANEAVEQIRGVSQSGINACCNHHAQTSGGFHWCYLTEFNQQGDVA